MKIKDKSVIYSITLIHLNRYVHDEKIARKQYAKDKQLANNNKRKMKLTDGISISGDCYGVLASEDCKILYDLNLLSYRPHITNFDNAVKLLHHLKKVFRNLF